MLALPAAVFLSALLPWPAAWTAAHPHSPKALVVQGAGGATTFTYFTVPYNAEHLQGLEPGFEWHLGYAALETEVPLRLAGDVAVPAARYKLGVVRGAGDDDWELLLEPWSLWRARATLARAVRRGQGADEARDALQAVRDRLTEDGLPERIVAPTRTRKAATAEHLGFELALRGFSTVRRFSTEAAAGVEMTLRVDFGDLHREIAVQEVFEPDGDD